MKASIVASLVATLIAGGLSHSSAETGTSRLVKSATVKIAGASNFDRLIERYAVEFGVPLALAHAVITVESNYDPDMLGLAGEIGLMQVKPDTARLLGYHGTVEGLYEPATNIRYGMMYLGRARELAGGDLCGTVLRYNAGHAAKRMTEGPLRYCGRVRQIFASN